MQCYNMCLRRWVGQNHNNKLGLLNLLKTFKLEISRKLQQSMNGLQFSMINIVLFVLFVNFQDLFHTCEDEKLCWTKSSAYVPQLSAEVHKLSANLSAEVRSAWLEVTPKLWWVMPNPMQPWPSGGASFVKNQEPCVFAIHSKILLYRSFFFG